ncbi:MAG: TIGR00282 family metallophosphoesterase [Clostridia bacterium]|nr:TIGR00282 family metallophosphoesterase [Clostridia bacterium]
MKILCVGDVVGSAGCNILKSKLPALKRNFGIDAIIVNGENSADGNGITPQSAAEIFDAGADVITGGNHSLRQSNAWHLHEDNPFVLRPANFTDAAPGCGYCLVDFGFTKMAVINLIGNVYMEPYSCPFETADRLISQAKKDGASIIAVDIHAEATAEKKALAFYLDGKVSFVFGTHTHVQTADCQVLPNGTGYITDLGMTGPFLSVLGVKPELSIRKIKDKVPTRFANAEGSCLLEGCLFTVTRDGKCEKAEALRIF